MELTATDFELFDLPPRQAQERAVLDARWRSLQAEVHPDRFAAEGAAAQRIAMQWTVRVNEAYQRLKNPLRRAAYLCELGGVPIDAENNVAMSKDFLLQQMAWREALEDADGPAAVEALAAQVAAARKELLARLESCLDRDRNPTEAAQHVRAGMFVERFAHDVERRLEALEH
ncbi:MAG: Fe-S protein assembly co-chaperone HscB [Piscinibacter sp.]|jgi:molecular chaperone HscB|nr:Fe-S protein assembly co-chaperone HscB [Piscinibacter sp.]